MTFAIIPQSFEKPVPASRARSKAQEIVDRTRDEVEGVIIGGGRRKLIQILVRTQKVLERQLEGERRRRGDETWTSSDLEATLVQVRAALGDLSPRFRKLLEENALAARKVGVNGTVELLEHFERKAGGGFVEGGVIRPLAIREAMAAQHTRLQDHATSVDRYGMRMIGVIRREMQAGIIRGATFDEMTTLLVGRKGPRGIVSMAAKENAGGGVTRTREETIDEGLFVRYRGWAERIVRTEGMAALNGGAQAEMVEQKEQRFPDLKRKIIATFDRRTASDSRGVHGEIREMNEPFVDGMGRVYMLPPARPNDREVVIPWRDAWAESAEPKAPPEKPETPAPPLPAPPIIASPAPTLPRTATASIVPATPSMTPVVRGIVEGVHVRKISATVDTRQRDYILGAVDDSGLHDFLVRVPLDTLSIRRGRINGREGLLGQYHRGRRTIDVTTADQSFGRPFNPGSAVGKTWNDAETAKSALDAARHTLTHELGHHVHRSGGPAVDQLVLNAYAARQSNPVTRYAATSPGEYFAETFAHHAYRRNALRSFDPVGFAMVEDVLRAQGIKR